MVKDNILNLNLNLCNKEWKKLNKTYGSYNTYLYEIIVII